MDDELIEAHGAVPQLMPFLHLPVQSGSDRILAAMNRKHGADAYRKVVDRLRAARPDLALSSDFIVGFPGETDAQFQATMDLIDEVGFDVSFSFIYSARPGTPAAALDDATPAAVKKERLQTLQAKIRSQATAIADAMVGTTQRVLVTERAQKDCRQLAGRTENNRVVNFAADAQLIGGFADVRITEALPNSLRGELACL